MEQRKAMFEQTSEDESVINNTEARCFQTQTQNLFFPENSDNYDIETRFLTEAELPEELLRRRKGYGKRNKGRKQDKRPKLNTEPLRQNLQDQFRTKPAEAPRKTPVFKMPSMKGPLVKTEPAAAAPPVEEDPAPDQKAPISVDSVDTNADPDGFFSIDLDLFDDEEQPATDFRII